MCRLARTLLEGHVDLVPARGGAHPVLGAVVFGVTVLGKEVISEVAPQLAKEVLYLLYGRFIFLPRQAKLLGDTLPRIGLGPDL